MTIGPLVAPFFLTFGLVRGAYIGTESFTAVVMHVTKLSIYGGTSVLRVNNATIGVLLGVVLMVGSCSGKRLVEKVSEWVFAGLIEVVLVVVGLYLLIAG